MRELERKPDPLFDVNETNYPSAVVSALGLIALVAFGIANFLASSPH